MLLALDAVVGLAGLLIPPTFDFIKKKFLKKGEDTPEATMSTLATTKPEVLPSYLTAVTGWLDAQSRFFNRDVTGQPSKWVIDLRAAIRPLGVVFSFIILAVMVAATLMDIEVKESAIPTLTGVRYSCEVILSSWFGDRITISSK